MFSKIFSSVVVHERLSPFKHKFKYNVLSMYIDYDELKGLSKDFTFFSYNKFNIFSFYDKDHGYRDDRFLTKYVKDFLKKNNVNYTNLKIKILCFPRIFGYVFNPLSVIYCFEKNHLLAIFYEVKNTSNEQHTYCFASNAYINKSVYRHACEKIFYVSPFIQMNCLYKFSTKIPKETFSVLIELFDNTNNKILIASQFGKKIKFSSLSLVRHLLINPLITFKVISAILYQSLLIMMKGGKYYSRKKKINDTISFIGSL